MGIVVPVVPRLLDWFSQCLLRDHSFELAQQSQTPVSYPSQVSSAQ